MQELVQERAKRFTRTSSRPLWLGEIHNGSRADEHLIDDVSRLTDNPFQRELMQS
jgi:hypothetical protein